MRWQLRDTHWLERNCCSAAAVSTRAESTETPHLDGIHQLLRRLPRHDGNCSRPRGLPLYDVAKVVQRWLGSEVCVRSRRAVFRLRRTASAPL